MSGQYEHIAVVERVLGRPLPYGAEVHHVDGNPKNNANGNLVVCQDLAYHKLLHVRQHAKAESGNPDWRKCWICKVWDSPERLVASKHRRRGPWRDSTRWMHRGCNAARTRFYAAHGTTRGFQPC